VLTEASKPLHKEARRIGARLSELQDVEAVQRQRRDSERQDERAEWAARQALHRRVAEAELKQRRQTAAAAAAEAEAEEQARMRAAERQAWHRSQAAETARSEAARKDFEARARASAEAEREASRRRGAEARNAQSTRAKDTVEQASPSECGGASACAGAAGGGGSWWGARAWSRAASGPRRNSASSNRESTADSAASREAPSLQPASPHPHQANERTTSQQRQELESEAASARAAQVAQAAAMQAARDEAARRTAEDEKQRQHRESVEREQAEALQRILRADADDYRVILNLPRGTSWSTLTTTGVTKAFRQQSLLVHPDKNAAPNADEGFKRLQAAYALLKEELCQLRTASMHAHPSSAAYPASSSMASGADYYTRSGTPSYRDYARSDYASRSGRGGASSSGAHAWEHERRAWERREDSTNHRGAGSGSQRSSSSRGSQRGVPPPAWGYC
jgi:hypothetical protein